MTILSRFRPLHSNSITVCLGPGMLTWHELEKSSYDKTVKKMREFQMLRGGKAEGYNPKLTAARAKFAKIESEIEKLIDTLTGANPLLLQYANSRIKELDAERQKQLKLVVGLTANSVLSSQIDSISDYLRNWDKVSFDGKRRVVDTLISKIEATASLSTLNNYLTANNLPLWKTMFI